MTAELERLLRVVSQDAAIRRVRRLQPTGGRGDKLFPPTFPKKDKSGSDVAGHAFEYRYTQPAAILPNGKNERRLCVLIDSVQSQANRLEEALSSARDSGDAFFPVIAVDFAKSEVADIGRLSTLQVPHRIFDAIVRDSLLGKDAFLRHSEVGKQLKLAKPNNAKAIFETSPTALVFGAWDSTGEGDSLGAKFPRAIVSEIVGIDVVTEPVERSHREGASSHDYEVREEASGIRTESRIDPLGIRSSVRVFKTSDGWSLEAPAKDGKDVKGAKGDKSEKTEKSKGESNTVKEVKPSVVNHSNIAPRIKNLGVTVDHALHTVVLSCGALRRLSFGAKAKDGDVAARATLAALGLLAVTAQDRNGYYLRSRCDLVPEPGQPSDFEIVRADGTTEAFALDYEGACKLLKEAHARAAEHGVHWFDEDIVLTPQPKLVELVKRSREKALQGVQEEEDGAR